MSGYLSYHLLKIFHCMKEQSQMDVHVSHTVQYVEERYPSKDNYFSCEGSSAVLARLCILQKEQQQEVEFLHASSVCNSKGRLMKLKHCSFSLETLLNTKLFCPVIFSHSAGGKNRAM